MSYNYVKLKQELERDEGRRKKIYKDSLGFKTIGVGHRLFDDPPMTLVWTDLQVDNALSDDIAMAMRRLDTNIPWWRDLSDTRQRVLINMCFNMGWGDGQHGLSSFVNTLRQIKNGEYALAAKNMLKSKWAKQVGARAVRLSKMMEEG